MPYQKKIWCAHPKHSNSTRSGRNPSHPVGRVIINAIQADMFNKEISSNAEWSSTRLIAGDKLCEQCFKFMSLLSNHLFDPQEMDIDIEDQRTTSDTSEENEDLVESPSSEEPLYLQQKATEELNAVFQLLKMGKIRDGLVFFLRLYVKFSVVFNSRRIKVIREQVDNVYRHLGGLCEILENNYAQPHEPNPHAIELDESNKLLSGMKQLYEQSTDAEQIRLMTIAPPDWGRIMLSKWFGSRDDQARQAIVLRREKGVLTYPGYSRGNKFLDDDTIQLVVQFYLQDGISRVSPNKKDVLKIKNESVVVRYLEMSIREALRQFYNDNPRIKIGKSSFYSLRPRQVKISSPHQTCMCQYHENMDLLLQVSVSIISKRNRLTLVQMLLNG